MTSPFIENLKSRIKSARLFGWRVTEIHSLIHFAIRRIVAGHLAQVAGSLTFTTVLALVPMLTIALAIFTAFPLFTTFRASLEAYFIQSLMPHAISSNILGYLNQFATKATRLSAYGAVALMVTSIAMLATIDRVFNQIWRVKQKRPLIKRMMVYWALITLAPLLMGVSITVTSYLFAATSDVVGALPGSKMLYTAASIIFTTCAFSLLYIIVPNRSIDWRDAAWGGLVAGVLFEIAKRIFAAFVIHIPTYTIVYGAVAIVPIFLIWIYTSWLITLFGAVIAASLPIVKYERWWHKPKPGSRFIDAIALLETLYAARARTNQAGISSWEIRQKTRFGFDEIEGLLTQMTKAGWVGRLHADEIVIKKPTPLVGSEWWVLLVNPNYLTLSQVYRLFVFETQADARLTQKVEIAIEQGLQESLEDYFLAKK
ncbi:YihY family inner membrane protein [Solimicrobium silvestre]|nr:YihY family inner membrane protein [Solimicrobium silvestre]